MGLKGHRTDVHQFKYLMYNKSEVKTKINIFRKKVTVRSNITLDLVPLGLSISSLPHECNVDRRSYKPLFSGQVHRTVLFTGVCGTRFRYKLKCVCMCIYVWIYVEIYFVNSSLTCTGGLSPVCSNCSSECEE